MSFQGPHFYPGSRSSANPAFKRFRSQAGTTQTPMMMPPPANNSKPVPHSGKKIPEYLQAMATKAKKLRQNTEWAPQTADTPAFVIKSDTPPDVIPFPSHWLTLNLAPPHGVVLRKRPAPPARRPPARNPFQMAL